MLKRTTGRLLLTLLVITGLAGTLGISSLSQKERKQAITLMKSSRNRLLSSIEGLTPKQMSYKPAPGESSIGELLINMVSLEQRCTDHIRSIMDQPSMSENRKMISMTDNQLLSYPVFPLLGLSLPANEKATFKDPGEALKKFLVLRDQHVKYIRTSTEDLRNHAVSTPAGWVDCYQYFLLLAGQSQYFSGKIDQVKSSPGFPR